VNLHSLEGSIMRAAQLTDNENSPRLVVTDVATPTAAAGEILIQVHAAGVIQTELDWYPTSHKKDGTRRVHTIPGHEFSGVVAAIGQGATGFSVGDEVYGMNDWYVQGATAEYCIALPAGIARKPRMLSHVQAASVPISALTAWQGLFDRANLRCGERVLVHGGAGAVGAYVVQLAKLHGAEVVVTATGAGADFVHSLGADVIVDYKQTQFEGVVSGVDVLFDCVGGDTLQRSWQTLGPGGRAVTIASAAESTVDDRTKQAFFIVEPRQEQLENVGVLIDGGSLRPFVAAVVPLDNAAAAYEGKVPREAGHGKIVIDLIPRL
jgi:NADPH:quinone reductase-like Zn-dependent oxidoreductase